MHARRGRGDDRAGAPGRVAVRRTAFVLRPDLGSVDRAAGSPAEAIDQLADVLLQRARGLSWFDRVGLRRVDDATLELRVEPR
jgi:hypothetical protein